ncbi:putative membrane protein YeaQ/YmgE (transglycosylase-associated protein family) [Paucibacter oligotrophus]|uniref:Putative membrane protein YeaQ/YmgE (Transglycosylase-associated protein family) n=1 Tax=Roseateles oligotrophus TaxID=1769250 RepID=A0A840L0I9_9BURK|nr:GlsB/YeaQ/YmgE family stress response membrane protein [Roseateles oligotrophus]MBB4841944.1 putative membrane protein YeaQ/YmgE (transglycosylase-associated protein family) [Roseateles oligotrophus]
MHYLWMFLIGIVVGAIARLIMPGSQNIGLLMTGVLGVAGSFVGGFIGRLVSGSADGSLLHPAGLLMSVVGAVLLLFIWGKLNS